MFRELDRICRDGAVLATNTSAIPITQIAAVTERPEAVVGTHFFSPVPMMALCELVRGYKTSDETLAARARLRRGGRQDLHRGQPRRRRLRHHPADLRAGHGGGRGWSRPAWPRAEDIDTACRLGFGHAMGPLATTDLTGVDILRNATLNIYTETAGREVLPAGAADAGWSPPATSAARPGRASTRYDD